MRFGWFSTGRGAGSRGLFLCVQEAISAGALPGEIAFVFCNREPGEHAGSDAYMALAQSYGIRVVALSSQRFRRRAGAPNHAAVRDAYDAAVIAALAGYTADVHVLAGYGLIFGDALAALRPALNLHPAAPDGPIGTWEEVIWRLIETQAAESGAFVHIATRALDRGPVAAYTTFPLRTPAIAPLWAACDGVPLAEMQSRGGDAVPLFQAIRQEGVRREGPLLREALRALCDGRIRVAGQAVVDSAGRPAQPLCLTELVEAALEPPPEGGRP